MNEPQAYLNGRFVPAHEAVVPVSDGGFVQGTTVAEQLRTFGGRLFRLDAHVDRLFRSLAIVEFDLAIKPAELAQAALELTAHNHRLLPAGDDLGVAIFVTPGPYAPMVAAGAAPGASICLHTFPLRFELWADGYERGQALATTDVEQISPRSWPPELKCRSRMHYYLADRQARARYPGSRALMVDEDGFITEATSANVVLYKAKGGLLMPPAEKVLPGISLAVLLELAEDLSIPYAERDLTALDVTAADEVFLTSTSICMLPVVRFNGQPIGGGAPGPAFARLLSAWNSLVGLDVAAQARQFARR